MSGSTHASISQDIINQRLDAKPTVGGRKRKITRHPATSPATRLLDLMSVDEFDALRAGELTAAELYAAHGVQR